MPSKNRTEYLGLNQWEGNEYPKRSDFVEDNAKIDQALKGVNQKIMSHQAEKATESVLGHVKVDGETIKAIDGIIRVESFSKAGSFTRSTTLGSGLQEISGLGFMPKSVIFLSAVSSVQGRMSIGFCDSSRNNFSIFNNHNAEAYSWTANENSSILIRQGINSEVQYYGKINQYNNDGFIVDWNKSTSAIDGEIITVYYLALR